MTLDKKKLNIYFFGKRSWCWMSNKRLTPLLPLHTQAKWLCRGRAYFLFLSIWFDVRIEGRTCKKGFVANCIFRTCAYSQVGGKNQIAIEIKLIKWLFSFERIANFGFFFFFLRTSYIGSVPVSLLPFHSLDSSHVPYSFPNSQPLFFSYYCGIYMYICSIYAYTYVYNLLSLFSTCGHW